MSIDNDVIDPLHFEHLCKGIHGRKSSVAIIRKNNRIELEIMQRGSIPIFLNSYDAELLRDFLIKHFPVNK